MSPSRKSRVLAGAAMGAAMGVTLAATFDPAFGQTILRPSPAAGHDGVYSIRIVTERGACDKSYLWTIAISGGRVISTGATPLQASGEIDRRGVVSMAFRGFNEVAHVVGRLKGRRGSGTWTSPTLDCAGTWRALRQS